MPIYPFQCPSCGRSEDQFAPVADRDANPPRCCGGAMARQLTAALVSVPASPGYQCPMTGEVVTTNRRRKYLMEQQGVVDARDYKESWARAQKAKEADRELGRQYVESLPDAVKRAAADLPA